MNHPTPHCVRCGASMPVDYPPERPCERCLLSLGMMTDSDPMIVPATHAPPGPSFPSRQDLEALHPELEIKEVLGEGGMGMVYRARQRDLDRDVALKVLRTDITAESGFAERFEREARTMARLSHPNIVSVHASGHSGTHYYLVMELVDGGNLRQLISRGAPDPKQALAIVRQICDALSYAHGQGIVHRDIKPENILISPEGQVKIVDFGLAMIAQDDLAGLRLTRTDQAMGTPQYMAPEQIERPLEVDHRADIYSMGVVFYELLTGELPLGRFAPPSEKTKLDGRLDNVVFRTLEKEPERRYQRVAQVKTDLDLSRTGTPPPLPHGAGAPKRSQSPQRERPHKNKSGCGWLVVAVLLLFCVLGALLIGVFGASSSNMQSNPTSATPGTPQPFTPGPAGNQLPPLELKIGEDGVQAVGK